jgi:hypothetical protein
VNLLTTKGIMDGGYGYQKIGDRAGIHCRTVADAVKVLDAAKGFETSIVHRAAQSIIPKEPYSSFLVGDDQDGAKPLKGCASRSCVPSWSSTRRTTRRSRPDRRRDQGRAARQARRGAARSHRSEVSRRSVDPESEYSFEDAFREILPSTVPDSSGRRTERRARVRRARLGRDQREVPLRALALGKAPLSPKINLRRIAKKTSQYEGRSAGTATSRCAATRASRLGHLGRELEVRQ